MNASASAAGERTAETRCDAKVRDEALTCPLQALPLAEDTSQAQTQPCAALVKLCWQLEATLPPVYAADYSTAVPAASDWLLGTYALSWPQAATYIHGHHESVLRSHTSRTAANCAGYLLPSLRPHMRILDIGCGPGTITADLAKLVPQGAPRDHACIPPNCV